MAPATEGKKFDELHHAKTKGRAEAIYQALAAPGDSVYKFERPLFTVS